LPAHKLGADLFRAANSAALPARTEVHYHQPELWRVGRVRTRDARPRL